jgi:dihydroorotate dehydrogenase (fumarate)
MDLSTQYLGLHLKNPLVPAASPLSEEVDNVKRMEDKGAAAVVFHSLFEEQIIAERLDQHHHLTEHSDAYPEALSFFPRPSVFHVGIDAYLEHLRQARAAVDIPLIGSLNGCTPGGWTSFAKDLEEAGAHALELNLYGVPSNPDRSGASVEDDALAVVREVVDAVSLPVAVKLSPYYSNVANFAKRLCEAGARGLVLFNRFYQPDLDLELLDVRPSIVLSSRHELRLPLQWLAILHGRLPLSLAATTGIHWAEDAIKALLVGADVTMLASALLRNGIEHLRTVEEGLRRWLDENDYVSVAQLKGSMSQLKVQDPSVFERAQYMRALQGYRRE